jgi:hypothetical protein
LGREKGGVITMPINDVMKALMGAIRPLSHEDKPMFLLVYIRMLLRSGNLSDATEKFEDLRNAMKYYFATDVVDDPRRLIEAFLGSNI